MKPVAVFRLLAVLLTASCIINVANCGLLCDKERFKEPLVNFCKSHPQPLQDELLAILYSALVKLRSDSQQPPHRGVVLPDTLSRMVTEFNGAFERFRNEHTEDNLIPEFQKLMDVALHIQNQTIDDGLCPHSCGIYQQDVIKCSNCRAVQHGCSSTEVCHTSAVQST